MTRTPMRALALAIALAETPACAALNAPKFENPVAAAKTAEQTAYALLETYAAVLEEATDLVRDPATPASLTQALARAERAATPAAETLRAAFVGYLRARADFEALPAGTPRAEKAAATLAIAAVRLDEAMRAAHRPITDLAALARR